MALYFYRALSKEGKKISGYLDGSSVESIRAQLTGKGLFPYEIKSQKEFSSQWNFVTSILERPVAPKDLIFFTKQLSVLLKSGIPLLQALELLADQFSGKLRSIIISLKDGVKEGKSLADGLSTYPQTFSNIYVQLVKAGEATGKLEIILDRLSEYLEHQEETQKKVGNALFYPLVQIGVIFVVVTIIVLVVIPNLESMLKASGQELPWTTKFLLGCSSLAKNYYLFILAGITAIAVGFQYWASQPQGKYTIDSIKLKLPLIRYFSQTHAIVQFCGTLGILLESGVNLAQALDIVCDIIDNTVLVERLKQAKDKIIKQGKITPFLKETGLFPPIATYLINTGEQSGKLDYMLLIVAKNYETDLLELTDRLTTNLPTVMTFVMAGIVGFIMMAVMGPILNMYNLAG